MVDDDVMNETEYSYVVSRLATDEADPHQPYRCHALIYHSSSSFLHPQSELRVGWRSYIIASLHSVSPLLAYSPTYSCTLSHPSHCISPFLPLSFRSSPFCAQLHGTVTICEFTIHAPSLSTTCGGISFPSKGICSARVSWFDG